MATKPTIVTLTNSSVDVLNAIRNSATTNYQNYVPVATSDANSIREIGAIIMDYPALQNEFLNALINRIGRVIITSKMYSNPWAMFKKGVLDYGETIEEIFVNIAKPFQFDPAVAEDEVFKREIPDVRSAFHVMNFQKFYKTTVSQEQLRMAFLSESGLIDLVGRIVNSLYAAANYDEFQVMKYMLAKHVLNGQLYPVTVSTVTAGNAPGIVSVIKGVSNNLTFMSPDYNLAGVPNYSMKNDQFLLVNSNFDAIMDVNVLAAAFHMEKAEFMGHVVLVDSFGKLDNDRLAALFDGDDTYTELTSDELTALNYIPAILVDRDWFMIYDNMYKFTDQYNSQGLYWNYFYHTWKTFSISPFANCALFVPGTPVVNSVTVSPSAITITAGQSASLSAVVDTEYFAPQAVDWTSSNELVTVTASGTVTVDASVASGTTVTITATSCYDSSVSGKCTVTVS